MSFLSGMVVWIGCDSMSGGCVCGEGYNFILCWLGEWPYVVFVAAGMVMVLGFFLGCPVR